MKKNVKRVMLFLGALGVGVVGSMYFAGAFTASPYIKQKEDTLEYNYSSTAYFAGGCFWCMEGIFEAQNGVEGSYSGYTGGDQGTATYEQTSAGNTGHREAVRVVYDPSIISFRKLVELYWTQINPTDDGGQFNDRGFVYSPAIYFSNDTEKEIAELSKQELIDSGRFEDDIVVVIEKAEQFYDAEEYHQDYYKKNPVRYKLYTSGSGRKGFIANNWQDRIDALNGKDYIDGKLVAQERKFKQFTDEQLRERLSPIQYKVTQQDGTEPAFNNKYWDNKEAGIYVDIIDGTPLYSSLDKFDSGTGWPSFTKGIDENNFTTHIDTRFFMTRTEVRSAKADSHLGHIFNDAPQELGGIRHCINSAALRFVSVQDLETQGYEEYLSLFQ